MGIYLGSNDLLGGGGGAQPGDLVAINQDGTATNDPTTNFIIDYNGSKYIRTGITIPTTSTTTNTYPDHILPPVTDESAVNDQQVGSDPAITSIENGIRSSVEIQSGSSLTRLLGHNTSQVALYFTPFGGDDTNIYASYLHGQTPQGLYIINKSTGAITDYQFPFGSTAPAALSSSARLSYIMGKGLLSNKLLCAFGNTSTEQGFMVLNKNGTVDTSFNTGLFSNGVYIQTSTGTPLYYGLAVNQNSKRWTGWMKVNPDEWASSSGASHINGSTTGNATIPSSNSFELRYVTIFGYIYPGGHYYTAIDHATCSMRSGIGLANAQLAMKWNMEDGTLAPNSTTWSATNSYNDYSYSNVSPGNFGDNYNTASEAQAALDALNTANSTSYHSFPIAHMRENYSATSYNDTYTSNGSIDSRVVSPYPYNKSNFNEIAGEPVIASTVTTIARTRGMLIFDSDNDDPSFWAFVRVAGFETEANPGVTVANKMYLVEYPATVAQRALSSSKGAQGYIRPMYYDIRDKSISFGSQGSTPLAGQRTTGPYTDIYHDDLVDGDKRSKFKFPIWVKLE